MKLKISICISLAFLVTAIFSYDYYKKLNPDCAAAKESYRSGLNFNSAIVANINLVKHKSCEFKRQGHILKNRKKFFSNCPFLKRKTYSSCLLNIYKNRELESATEIMFRGLNLVSATHLDIKDNKTKTKTKSQYLLQFNMLTFLHNMSYKELLFTKNNTSPWNGTKSHTKMMISELSAYNSAKSKMIENTERKLMKLHAILNRKPASKRDSNLRKKYHLKGLAILKKTRKKFNEENKQIGKVFENHGLNL